MCGADILHLDVLIIKTLQVAGGEHGDAGSGGGGGMVNVPINAGNIAPFHSENTSCQHGRGCRHTHDLINETKVW